MTPALYLMAALFARRVVAPLVSNANSSEDHEVGHGDAAHFVETKRVADCADDSLIDALKPLRPVVRQLGRVSRLR
jgi:hypothetical protein